MKKALTLGFSKEINLEQELSEDFDTPINDKHNLIQQEKDIIADLNFHNWSNLPTIFKLREEAEYKGGANAEVVAIKGVKNANCNPTYMVLGKQGTLFNVQGDLLKSEP
eukprot:7334268-Ditylum_brightwellii.AAC.1